MAHTFSYSVVALQEMNLAYKFPIIYWNCANLIVDSGSAGKTDVDDEETSEDPDNDEDDDTKKAVSRSVDYGKISMAIGKMKAHGILVTLPDINKSDYTFTPDVTAGIIRYGIKGITRISDSLVDTIILNRPYYSLDDFAQKVSVNKTQMINLIKAGCFDNLENLTRETILKNYVASFADVKTRLTLQNMPYLVKSNLIPDEMEKYGRLFNFRQHLKNCIEGIYTKLDADEFEFYSNWFGVDTVVTLDDGSPAIKTTDWEKQYKKAMKPMADYLKENKDMMLKKVNSKAINSEMEKYASGDVEHWEMDSVGFYSNDHELQKYYNLGYINGEQLSDFYKLPENPPIVTETETARGYKITIYKLSHIAGTVIQKNKTKHTVTLLCNDGVVEVKVWDAQFTKYDKQISERQEDGKKKVMERSWFTRGNRLFLTGIRRGNSFVPKIYNTQHEIFKTPIILINENDEFVTKRWDEE